MTKKGKGKTRAKTNRKNRNKSKNEYFLRRKKMLSKLRKWEDPILSQKCSLVGEQEDVTQIIKELKAVLVFSDNGVGIAASQIGYTKSIIAIRPNRKSGIIYILINPEIIEKSEEKITWKEGCLSYPDFFAPVERHKVISVSFLDENKSKVVKQYREIESIVIQHEVDHTVGICHVGEAWRKQQDDEVVEAKT